MNLPDVDLLKLYDEAFKSVFPDLPGQKAEPPVLQIMALREFARRLLASSSIASPTTGLTEEHIEGWREKFQQTFGPYAVPAYEEICDLALKASRPDAALEQSEYRRGLLEGALSRLLDALVAHPSKDLHPAVDNAKAILRASLSPLSANTATDK